MIAYLDSSFLVRAYLADEPSHPAVLAVLDDAGLARVTGSWTRIEVTGALVRAARARRGRADRLLARLDQDLGQGGRVAVVDAPQRQVEEAALGLVRQHGLRAMDAWHLAVARIVLPELAEPGEEQRFSSRDGDQAAVAAEMGFGAL